MHGTVIILRASVIDACTNIYVLICNFRLYSYFGKIEKKIDFLKTDLIDHRLIGKKSGPLAEKALQFGCPTKSHSVIQHLEHILSYPTGVKFHKDVLYLLV